MANIHNPTLIGLHKFLRIVAKIEDRIIKVKSVRVLVDYKLAELFQLGMKILLPSMQRNPDASQAILCLDSQLMNTST